MIPGKEVPQDEYTDFLCHHITPEGNKLFQHAGKWVDN